MQSFLFAVAFIALVFVLFSRVYLVAGGRSIKLLKDLPAPDRGRYPKVSVIVAARNEEAKIEEALQSVLSQDYGDLEVIVADDRSSDATGQILDRMAQSCSMLRIVHITDLPKGILGKNHAMQVAADSATGEILLFTDADVFMEPSSLRRAVNYMLENRIDHITAGFDIKIPGALPELMIGYFTIAFSIFSRPWKAIDPKSSAFVGIGAFNLVRTDVYKAIGGHWAVRMRPDEDMKFGKHIKKSGYRQEFLNGAGMIAVEWYSSLRDLVKGLEKNAFAAVDYSLAMIAAATIFQLLVFVWPFIALFTTHGVVWVVNALIAVALMELYRHAADYGRVRKIYAPGIPVAACIFIYILWNSAIKTLYKHGVEWRDTHYDLDELRANKI